MSSGRSRPWHNPTPLPGFEPVWLGQFDTFHDWVDHATRALADFQGSMGEKISAICVDALGRRCHCGADFQRARDEDAFPVRYFLEGSVTGTSGPAPEELRSEAVRSEMQLWRVVISIPQIDTDYLIASDAQPTHEQIEAVWRAAHPSTSTARPPRPLRPLGWRGPLAEAYPGVGRIEQVKTWLPPAPAGRGEE